MWLQLLDKLGIASKQHVSDEIRKVMNYNMEIIDSLNAVRNDIKQILADLDKKQDALGK